MSPACTRGFGREFYPTANLFALRRGDHESSQIRRPYSASTCVEPHVNRPRRLEGIVDRQPRLPDGDGIHPIELAVADRRPAAERLPGRLRRRAAFEGVLRDVLAA